MATSAKHSNLIMVQGSGPAGQRGGWGGGEAGAKVSIIPGI